MDARQDPHTEISKKHGHRGRLFASDLTGGHVEGFLQVTLEVDMRGIICRCPPGWAKGMDIDAEINHLCYKNSGVADLDSNPHSNTD